MNDSLQLALSWHDWLALFGQYLLLSLLSIGGAITTAPDMHRYLVDQRGWLTDMQFNNAISIAQAAPGPNILFIALLGWQVGLNSGGIALGMLGVFVTMTGILLPSTALAYAVARWSQRNAELRAVRAFKQGMAPLVIALLLATGWIVARAHAGTLQQWPLWLLTAAAALIVWRTRVHLLWLLGAGALLGWFGLV